MTAECGAFDYFRVVVPAKAGTQTAGSIESARSMYRAMKRNYQPSPNPILWLWVPAFAGTTVFGLAGCIATPAI